MTIPRPPRSGLRPGAVARAGALLLAVLLAPAALGAQEPPDSVAPPDSLGLVPDSLAALLDTAQARPDAPADSAAADSVFHNLPLVPGDVPEGWARDVWTWTRDDILAAGANTLVELVQDVPGMVPLRGGDYGAPLGLTAFGIAGGALRLFRDGVEVFPLEGSVPDLARIGLGGVDEVRLERHPGELRIHLRGLRYTEGPPVSLIEAGTGDLDTNVFRGSFADPTALGGSVALSIERADTRGPLGNEPGNRTGSWIRYQLHRGDGAGLAVDFRRMGSETEVPDYASKVTRTDWSVRGRARLAPGLVGEAFWARAQHRVEDPRDAYATEGGTRSQTGLRLGWEAGPLVARGAYRRFGGGELPSDRLDLRAGLARAGIGGAVWELDRADWAGEGTSARRLRAWTAPFLGLSLFGSWESGSRGVRAAPVRDVMPPPDTTATEEPDTLEPEPPVEMPPDFRIVERSASRVGARFAWGGIELSGALLEVEADSLLPTGLEFDRGEPALPGGTRSGWEAWGRLPIPLLDGLHVEGSLQQWDSAWSYGPERVYQGAFVYHDTYTPGGNAELWVRLGVRGRDPMSVRTVVGELVDEETGDVLGPELGAVPFYQSWFGVIQFRVVTVRIFVGWENFTVRRNLQDLPGRVLPRTRAFYGLRWTMKN